jgi:hypothetical protein
MPWGVIPSISALQDWVVVILVPAMGGDCKYEHVYVSVDAFRPARTILSPWLVLPNCLVSKSRSSREDLLRGDRPLTPFAPLVGRNVRIQP